MLHGCQLLPDVLPLTQRSNPCASCLFPAPPWPWVAPWCCGNGEPGLPGSAAQCHLYPSFQQAGACMDSRSRHAGLYQQLGSPCSDLEGTSHAKSRPPGLQLTVGAGSSWHPFFRPLPKPSHEVLGRTEGEGAAGRADSPGSGGGGTCSHQIFPQTSPALRRAHWKERI